MAFDGTYYKIYEFVSADIQHDNAGAIASTSLPWPNALKPNYEQQTYTWQGGASRKIINLLLAVNYTLDLDVTPLSAHKSIFGKSEITDPGTADSLFDVSTIVGFGGGNDAAGVTRGLYCVANALAGATETVVQVAFWLPICTVTLGAAGGLSSGNIGDKFTYNFSATKTAVDITNTAIAGASSGGEFFYIGEVT